MHLKFLWDIWTMFLDIFQEMCHCLYRWHSDFKQIMGWAFVVASISDNNLRQHKLWLSLDNFSFAMNRFKYLDYVIDSVGIRVNPETINAIKDWPTPKRILELRSFLGLVNFYYIFWHNVSQQLSFLQRKIRIIQV